MSKTTKSPKSESGLQNRLKELRTNLGLSQQELAQAAGVARQTIGGIEAALYAPSALVALRLARALGCRVEEIFQLEEEMAPVLTAARVKSEGLPTRQETGERVLVAQVGEKWVAHSLAGEAAFRSEMVPADGVALSVGDEVEVQLLDSLEALTRTVLIAGCAPALSLWTRSAQRWHPGLRAAWIHANSTKALEAMARGEVHIAGLHLCDPQTGEENVPFVHHALPNQNIVLLNFGVWDEGLMVAAGNPKKLRGVGDLSRENVTFINREAGAGSRLLFDTLLAQENVSAESIQGYTQSASSHKTVAQSVSRGEADAGMGTAAMAQIYGLDFLPLRRVRFDFAVREEFLGYEPVSQLLETLAHRPIQLQLQTLGGYDTTLTGEVVARLGAA